MDETWAVRSTANLDLRAAFGGSISSSWAFGDREHRAAALWFVFISEIRTAFDLVVDSLSSDDSRSRDQPQRSVFR